MESSKEGQRKLIIKEYELLPTSLLGNLCYAMTHILLAQGLLK